MGFACAIVRLAALAACGAAIHTPRLSARQLKGDDHDEPSGVDLAIIVPGGGLTSESLPTAWVLRRLREASEMYHRKRAAGEDAVIVTLSGGTPHKPEPVDPSSGFQVKEAEANARCLIHDFKVPPEHVFEEDWSLDTIGNAYMLRSIHTDVAGWRRLLVVNNEFHMARTRAIFAKVFSLAPQPAFGAYHIDFVEVPNDGLDSEVLGSRREREAASASSFRSTTADIGTMRAMHRFLFTDHMAYASKRLLRARKRVDETVLQSY